jgi:hypothetical protein
MKTADFQAQIDALELQRTALHKEKEAFVVPCPDCKHNVLGIKVDPNGNAECPKCCAAITREDVQVYTDESNRLWQALCQTSSDISVLRTRKHVHELHQGLKPWRKFLQGGCQYKDFTGPLYTMLSHTFHNIAHFSKDRFFHVQFQDLPTIVATLGRMKAHVAAHPAEPDPVSKGHGRFYQKLEKRIFGEFENGLLESLSYRLEYENEAQEMAEYERLQAKYQVQS